jgi:hypothetical protein
VRGVQLSYHLYYHGGMAQREKRSVSLPPELAQAIDAAAADDGTTFSAWLADTSSTSPSSKGRSAAARVRLRIEGV